MSDLINRLFSKSQANAIKALQEDHSSHRLLKEEIAKKLIKTEEIVIEDPISQLNLVISTSPFATSDDECVEIAKIVHWGLSTIDILPSIVEHDGQELAYRCLISLSFFKGVMERKYERYGAPDPNFYREIGKTSFHRMGSYEVSEHFSQWEHFMGDAFKGFGEKK